MSVATGAKAFERFLDVDTQRMAEGMRVLAGDLHFREAVTANDRAPLTPMLVKIGRGIGAPLTLLIGVDRRVIAATVEPEVGRGIAFPKLLDRAL